MTTRADEPLELAWIAFCADCEHETLPVTGGHRVCLVYKPDHEGEQYSCRGAGSRIPGRPHRGGIVDLAERLCERFVDRGEDPAWRDTLRAMVATLCAEMLNLDEHRTDRSLPVCSFQQQRAPCRLKRSAGYSPWQGASRLAEEAGAAVAFFIRRADMVPPVRTVPVLLERLLSEEEATGTGGAFADLWCHAAAFLLERKRIGAGAASGLETADGALDLRLRALRRAAQVLCRPGRRSAPLRGPHRVEGIYRNGDRAGGHRHPLRDRASGLTPAR